MCMKQSLRATFVILAACGTAIGTSGCQSSRIGNLPKLSDVRLSQMPGLKWMGRLRGDQPKKELADATSSTHLQRHRQLPTTVGSRRSHLKTNPMEAIQPRHRRTQAMELMELMELIPRVVTIPDRTTRPPQPQATRARSPEVHLGPKTDFIRLLPVHNHR